MVKIVEQHIKSIVDASLGNLFFMNYREEDLKTKNNYPMLIAMVETGGVNDYDSVDVRPTRLYDVEMTILEPIPRKGFMDGPNGKRIPESDLEFSLRMSERREEMVGILEQIIYYLVDERFPFKYVMFSNIQYNSVFFEDTDLNVFGKSVTFTLQRNFTKQLCCFDFDEDAIKLVNPKKC